MAARLSNKRQTASAPPREAKPGDNLAPEERRKAENELQELAAISVVSALRAQAPKTQAARDALKVETEAEGAIYSDAKRDWKFTKAEIKGWLDDIGAKRRDVETAEEKRYRIRSRLGLPVGKPPEQQELEDRLPEVERNAQHWRAAGYTAALSGGDTTPPAECVAAGHVGPWSAGVDDGIAANGAAIKKLTTPKKPPPKPPSDEPKTVAEEQAEERKAIERGKAALAQMKPIPEPDPNAKPDDFEAPKEELDAQSTRRAVVDAKTGATTGEPGDDGEGV